MMFLVLGLGGTLAGADIAGDVVIGAGETVEFEAGGTRYTGTLTIEAGATLRFPPGAFLEMWRDTQFVVNGTEEAPVVFECTNPTKRWSGILIEARSTGVVRHARFTGVVNGFSLRTDSSLVIRDSSFSMGEPGVVEAFTGFGTAGISGTGASIDVDRCEFGPFVGGRGVNASSGDGGVGRPAYGILMQDYNDVRVTNSVFRDITGGRGGRGARGPGGMNGEDWGDSGEDGGVGGHGGDGGTADGE